MTMTDEPEVKAPAPAKKKTKAKKRSAAPRPAVKAESPYAGMTVKDCCSKCNVNGCVISGKSYCAHPRKNGLHPNEMSDSGALRRRKEAETMLRNQVLAAG